MLKKEELSDMRSRILYHILFWLCYLSLYVIVHMLFVSPSDEGYSFSVKLLRYFFQELVFLPWKILPFYFLFYYLIPKYLPTHDYLKIASAFLLILFVCLLGYRSTIEPVQKLLYGDTPDFNVFSFSRIFYTLTDVLPAIALAATAKLLKGSIVSRRTQLKLEEEKNKAELNFLKAQTNPHFLFNTLNNLYGLARRNDANTAQSILKLSNLMRYILYECDTDTNTIETEIKLIEDYIDLEKLRYDDSLNLTFEKNIDDWTYQISPLILLPFVENAFKHGASENREATSIYINLNVENNQLSFSIENSIEADMLTSNEGIGLSNVKRQLDLIYRDDYNLSFERTGKTFLVNLNIYSNSYV